MPKISVQPKKISVCISTRRFGGLIRQIDLFQYQTFPKDEFELVVIDGLYWLRAQEAMDKAAEYGLNLTYRRPRKLDRKVSIDHASMRNDALTYANGELVVFFDDYQIPDNRLLEEHWKVYNYSANPCCIGRQQYFKETDFESGKRIELCDSDNPKLGDTEREVPSSIFYTNNCSAPLSKLIEVNGFDERYNSGTGGEDYDCGTRLGRLGSRTVYNPRALCYHMQHSQIDMYPSSPATCSHIYSSKTKGVFQSRFPTEQDIDWIDWDDIEHYACNDYRRYGPKFGNHDRSSLYSDGKLTGKSTTNTLSTWEADGLVFFKCQVCDLEGILDSMPLYEWNNEHSVIVAPREYFDLISTRRNA
jgi:hypothetical protein